MSLKDKIYVFILYIYNSIFWKTLYKRNLYKWFLNEWDNTKLINYPLNKDSVVIDVWGYIWIFSDKIVKKYDCYVYIFEPIKKYYDILIEKYKWNNKIKVFHFWLWDKFEEIEIRIDWERSSVFIDQWSLETITIRPFDEIVKEENISSIELISINIEGWEYDLINNIVEHKIISMIQNIQIQFLDFIDWAVEKRQKSIQMIWVTHDINFSYPFVRESFTKKKN